MLGWAVTTAVWTSPVKALAPASKTYANLPGIIALILTYFAMLAVLLVGAKALGANVKRFAAGFYSRIRRELCLLVHRQLGLYCSHSRQARCAASSLVAEPDQ